MKVRKSYPKIPPKSIELLCKAASKLRKLQSEFTNENRKAQHELSAEMSNILRSILHDRDKCIEVAA